MTRACWHLGKANRCTNFFRPSACLPGATSLLGDRAKPKPLWSRRGHVGPVAFADRQNVAGHRPGAVSTTGKARAVKDCKLFCPASGGVHSATGTSFHTLNQEFARCLPGTVFPRPSPFPPCRQTRAVRLAEFLGAPILSPTWLASLGPLFDLRRAFSPSPQDLRTPAKAALLMSAFSAGAVFEVYNLCVLTADSLIFFGWWPRLAKGLSPVTGWRYSLARDLCAVGQGHGARSV